MLRGLKGSAWEGCGEVRAAVQRLGDIRRAVRRRGGANVSFIAFECEAAMSRFPFQWSEGVKGAGERRELAPPPMYPNNQGLDFTPQHFPLRFLVAEFPELARLHAKAQGIMRGQRRSSQVKKKVRPLAVASNGGKARAAGSSAPPTPINDLRRR